MHTGCVEVMTDGRPKELALMNREHDRYSNDCDIFRAVLNIERFLCDNSASC